MDKYLLHDHCHYLLSVDSGHLSRSHFQLLYHLCIVRNMIIFITTLSAYINDKYCPVSSSCGLYLSLNKYGKN